MSIPPMPPTPKRQVIQASKEPATTVIGKRTEVRDYSYHTDNGALVQVWVRKVDGGQPSIMVNGVNWPLGWLAD
jgi:hypothetical protein